MRSMVHWKHLVPALAVLLVPLCGCAPTEERRPSVAVSEEEEPAFTEAPPEPLAAEITSLPSVRPATEVAGDPLSKPLDVHLRGQPLARAIAVISLLSDMDILVLPDAAEPEQLDQLQITLRMREASARAALDWVVRSMGARYRVMSGSVIRIYRDDQWIFEEQPVTEAYRSGTYAFIDRPMGRSYSLEGTPEQTTPPELPSAYDFARERQATLALFHAILGYVEVRCKGTSLMFDPSRTTLVSAQPPFAQVKVAQVIAELNRWQDHSRPARRRRSPWQGRCDSALVAPVSCDAQGQPFDLLAWSLAEQAGLSIGWNSLDPAVQSDQPITLKLDLVPLAAALKQLLPLAGFDRFEMEPDHGIWLLRKDDPSALREPVEFFWDACVVRSYYVAPLLQQYKIKELLRMIRVAVTPDLWNAGPPAMAYHGPTQRLIVLHTPASQEAISHYLHTLSLSLDRRGPE